MVKKHKLCPVKIISKASQIYQKYWKEFLFLLTLVFLSSAISSFGLRVDPITGAVIQTGLSKFFGTISWLLIAYITFASIRYTLKLIHGKYEKVDAIFSEVKSFASYFHFILGKIIVSLVFSFLVVFLLVTPFFLVGGFGAMRANPYLYILPLAGIFVTIYITLSLFLVPYLIADKDMGVFEALVTSWKQMRGKKCKIFMLGVFLLLLNILGVLAFGFGLLITVPITMIAGVVAYDEIEKLSSHKHS